MRRTEFLAMVTDAVTAARPEGIARIDTIMEGLDATGLEVTTTDGTVLRLRPLCTSGRGDCTTDRRMPGRRYSRRSI